MLRSILCCCPDIADSSFILSIEIVHHRHFTIMFLRRIFSGWYCNKYGHSRCWSSAHLVNTIFFVYSPLNYRSNRSQTFETQFFLETDATIFWCLYNKNIIVKPIYVGQGRAAMKLWWHCYNKKLRSVKFRHLFTKVENEKNDRFGILQYYCCNPFFANIR